MGFSLRCAEVICFAHISTSFVSPLNEITLASGSSSNLLRQPDCRHMPLEAPTSTTVPMSSPRAATRQSARSVDMPRSVTTSSGSAILASGGSATRGGGDAAPSDHATNFLKNNSCTGPAPQSVRQSCALPGGAPWKVSSRCLLPGEVTPCRHSREPRLFPSIAKQGNRGTIAAPHCGTGLGRIDDLTVWD